MIASLNQETGEVKVTSIYRDTLLQLSDGTYNKANSAYSFGGVELSLIHIYKNASFWYLLGGDIAGNLYVNLYRWLQKQQHKYECDKICFLARDGYNMYQICKKVNESHVIYLEM